MSQTAAVVSEALCCLRSASTIRERCHQIFSIAQKDSLSWFSLSMDRLEGVVNAVYKETLATYPDLSIPYHSRWRHFSVGGIDRESVVDRALSHLPNLERCRSKLELAIVSVLLDAGAGNTWEYSEIASGRRYGRSEGLAVASLAAFAQGFFGDLPYTVTAAKLSSITTAELADAFQDSDSNRLVGLEGRCALLNRLGEIVEQRGESFLGTPGRLGGMLEGIATLAPVGSVIPAGELLRFVLETFADIWPGRISLGGVNLGDVWRHSHVVGDGLTEGLIPFHKLSQWLTYSLLEPLKEAGIEVGQLGQLTGLPEYRNGGLFIDGGVLALKDATLLEIKHQPSSELVVEWRALTVVLLDELANALRRKLGLSDEELPLAKVLQGGTWSVGRKMAAERRTAAAPPLVIDSDGTVF